MNTQIKADLLKNAVIATVTMKKWGNRRKAATAALTENEAGESTGTLATKEVDRLSVTKKLIKSKEYDAILNYQQNLYCWVKARTVPSFIKDGFYLLNVDKVAEFSVKFQEAEKELKELVAKLVAVYPAKIEEAKKAFEGGKLFRQSDYPSSESLAALFSVEYNLFEFELSQKLPPEVFEAERVKIEKSFEEAKTLVAECLTEGFSGLLASVQEKLAPGADGQAKGFHKTLFDDLTEFIENFNSRNLINDKDLGALVDKANAILSSVRGGKPTEKASVLRDSDQLRDETRAKFAVIQTEIEATIRPKLMRKFSFDE